MILCRLTTLTVLRPLHHDFVSSGDINSFRPLHHDFVSSDDVNSF